MALIVGIRKALVNVPRCSQQTQTYWVVYVIRRVKASTTEWATRECQCIQLSPFVNKVCAHFVNKVCAFVNKVCASLPPRRTRGGAGHGQSERSDGAESPGTILHSQEAPYVGGPRRRAGPRAGGVRGRQEPQGSRDIQI